MFFVFQYESPSSDEGSNDEDNPTSDQQSITAAHPMLYNSRVNMNYIRARIRHHNNVRRRPSGRNGDALAEVDACGALSQQTRANG